MSRTAYEMNVPNFDRAVGIVADVLQRNGFTPKQKDGENVWQKGAGFWTARKFVSLERRGENQLCIYAWIKPFLSPETSLDHKFAGAIPINQLKKVMDEVLNALKTGF